MFASYVKAHTLTDWDACPFQATSPEGKSRPFFRGIVCMASTQARRVDMPHLLARARASLGESMTCNKLDDLLDDLLDLLDLEQARRCGTSSRPARRDCRSLVGENIVREGSERPSRLPGHDSDAILATRCMLSTLFLPSIR